VEVDVVLFAGAATLMGCGSPGADEDVVVPREPYVERGDLDALRARGQLRILVPEQARVAHLPRQGFPLDHELTLAQEFAAAVHLEPVVIYVQEHGDILPWLLAGKGDIAVDTLHATEERKQRVAFTEPLALAREQLVSRVGDGPFEGPADLVGRTVVVRKSSAYWSTVAALTQDHPGIRLEAAPEHLDVEEIVHEVGNGTFDLTVVDDDQLAAILHYRADVAAALDLTPPLPVAWAVRPDSPALLEALNRYVNEADLGHALPEAYREDLPALKERGVLRMLTRNSAATYFLHRGELMGFEYELWRRFAERHGMRLQVVVADGHDELLPWLVDGRGDLVAAGLTETEHLLHQEVLGWSVPYHEAAEVVVGRRGVSVRSPADLAGHTIAVRRSSAHWETLTALKASGVDLTLRAVPEDVEDEQILAAVAAGTHELTVADRHVVDIELAHHVPVEVAFALTPPRPHGVAVRAADTELLAAIDAFIEAERGGAFYNTLRRRYFEDRRRIAHDSEERSDRGAALSPFDPLVRRYANHYGFDWRLIVAQMYQESHFDPHAKSWVGAQGLLQLMPRTAQELGFTDVVAPEGGIHAGVMYLHRMRDRFEADLGVEDRTWFALASYNAGLGHVVDARRLAEQLGLDANRWIDHTERAMLLLADAEHARTARHGYVRGQEPVDYVRRIRNRFLAYSGVTEVGADPLAPPAPPVR
jgi:membrane-bound lytic murein transglycosylase F